MAVVEPEVVAQLKRSLRTLGTDHVDVYQFHSGSDAVFENNELWEALAAQRQAGKVRFLGVSLGDNQSSRQTERATEIGADIAAWALAWVLRDPAVTSVIRAASSWSTRSPTRLRRTSFSPSTGRTVA